MSKAKDVGYWILAAILTVLFLGGYLFFVNVAPGPDRSPPPEMLIKSDFEKDLELYGPEKAADLLIERIERELSEMAKEAEQERQEYQLLTEGEFVDRVLKEAKDE